MEITEVVQDEEAALEAAGVNKDNSGHRFYGGRCANCHMEQSVFESKGGECENQKGKEVRENG